jgi:hypothetical protein
MQIKKISFYIVSGCMVLSASVDAMQKGTFFEKRMQQIRQANIESDMRRLEDWFELERKKSKVQKFVQTFSAPEGAGKHTQDVLYDTFLKQLRAAGLENTWKLFKHKYVKNSLKEKRPPVKNKRIHNSCLPLARSKKLSHRQRQRAHWNFIKELEKREDGKRAARKSKRHVPLYLRHGATTACL